MALLHLLFLISAQAFAESFFNSGSTGQKPAGPLPRNGSAALFGALFVLCCDLIGRLIILPYELPIELIIGTLGSLIFIVLIFYRLRFGRRSLNKDLLMKLFGFEKKTPVCSSINGGAR